MKKQKRPAKLPGQGAPTEKEKILSEKDQERRGTMYGIFRTIFEAQCVGLGVQEVCEMKYTKGGILPDVRVVPFAEEERDSRYHYILGRMKDMYAMGKSGDPHFKNCIQQMKDQITEIEELMNEVDNPPPPKAPILGADGKPIQS